MSGGKLEVTIGADISDFEKKIKEVEFDIKELSKVKLERIKVGLDTKEINAQIKDAKNSLAGLRTAIKDTGGQVGGQFTKQVGNGNNALMQFSRIAQDAPYGIIGIGNNLTATGEAFGYLRTQTGSTSGALKAMATSLMGTGGLLLGISLLTTGFTLLAQSGLSVGDIIDKATGKFDEFGESVNKAREEGLKSAGKEVQSLKELVAVAQNENIAKKDRLIAVQDLQKTYPAYFGNLSNEKILYGDLTSAVNATTSALIAKSVAEKLGDKAGDKFIERLNAQKKFNDSKKELDDLEKKQEKELAGLKNVSAAQVARIQLRQLYAKNDLINRTEDERQEVVKLVKEYDNLGNVINKLNQIRAPLNQTAPKAQKAQKAPKKEKFEFEEGFTGGFVSPVSFTSNALLGTDALIAKMKTLPLKVSESLTETQLILIEFNNSVNDLIQNSIAGTFASLGDTIGNAIATGGNVLSAVGNGLIQSLGSFLSQLGDKLITYGLLLAGFGKAELAFKYGTPEVKIGAGIAMVALGVAAKAAGAMVSSAGSRGLSGGGGASSSTGSDANNRSFTSGGFSGGSSTNGGTVVFEIAGQKLIGVLSNTLNANKRLGGQSTLAI